MLLEAGSDVNAKESTRGQSALMFAVAANRVEAMKLLIASGADAKATTKVVDLTGQTNPDEEEFLRAQRQGGAGRGGGGYPVPDAAGGASAAVTSRGQPAAQPVAGRSGRGGPGGGRGTGPDVAGLTRQFRFAELVSAQGGLHAIAVRRASGLCRSAGSLLDAGVDVNQVSAGDKTSPLLMATINGHFDLGIELLKRGANPKNYRATTVSRRSTPH